MAHGVQRGRGAVPALFDQACYNVFRVIGRGVHDEPRVGILTRLFARSGLASNAYRQIGEVRRRTRGLLIDDAFKCVVHEIELALVVNLGGQALLRARLVVEIGIALAITCDGREEDMRRVFQAVHGDAAVPRSHLQRGDQDIALADNDVRHVSRVPSTVFIRIT